MSSDCTYNPFVEMGVNLFGCHSSCVKVSYIMIFPFPQILKQLVHNYSTNRSRRLGCLILHEYF